MPDVQFAALQRIIRYLREKQLDEETIGFLTGRMARVISDATGVVVADALGEEAVKKLQEIPDEVEKQKAIADAYQAKTGKSLDQVREELTEKLVQDFEKA